MGDVRGDTETKLLPSELERSGDLAALPPPPPTPVETHNRDKVVFGPPDCLTNGGCKSVAAPDADLEAVLADFLGAAAESSLETLATGDRPPGTLQEPAPPLGGSGFVDRLLSCN